MGELAWRRCRAGMLLPNSLLLTDSAETQKGPLVDISTIILFLLGFRAWTMKSETRHSMDLGI